MKKFLLLLAAVGLVFTACEGGEGVEEEIPADKTQAIKFQDENTKLLCTLHWDENEDGELSYEEAAAVTDLGTAFKGSSILAFTELKYFTSLEKIADSAFEGCSSLTSVTIPDSVTSIGGSAFYDCSSLTSVTIGDSVTEIGDRAFVRCSSLTSVSIPDSVTEIGDRAFYDCSSLESITIPDSVTSIGEYAFYNCSSLTAFYGKFASEDNRCLIVDGVLNSFAPSGLTSYTIPDSVTSIGDYAFSKCSSLTSVTIPDSVTSIGVHAFSNCSSLKEVYCKSTTPPTGDYYMFYSNASGRKIYVPTASVEAYKAAEYWSDYSSYIVGYDF